MIHLTYSNRTEALLLALARRLDARRRRGDDPLEPVLLVVPNRNVERYVELGIARTLGIAANLRFLRLSRFVETWLETDGQELLLGDALASRVLLALTDPELLDLAPLAPVRRYLFSQSQDPDAVDLRRAQLVLHVAHLFEEYGFSRPELLAAWRRGARLFESDPSAHRQEAWQAEVFCFVRDHPAAPRGVTLTEALQHPRPAPAAELHVFGLSYVARVFNHVFDTLSERSDLYLYALNPCEEYWEDLETAAELRRRRKKSDAEPEWWLDDEDPFGLSVDRESPLLRQLGRPGREYVRLLGALTECDFEGVFEDPLPAASETHPLPLFARLDTPSLLQRLQHDVLRRTPERTSSPAAARDDSVQVFACPSVRREVESVVAEIRVLMESVDDLSFDQIAVLVNGPDRERYLPHIESAFEEAGRLPYAVADLALAAVSPVVEGALRLLALPTSALTRKDLLGVIAHPKVFAGGPDHDPRDFVDLVERLGIFHGLDAASHRGTYLEGQDRVSWDQGLKRIALGAFMDEDFVELDHPGAEPTARARYLPEVDALFGDRNARFAQLVRSLSSDVRFARERRLRMSDWVRFMSAALSSYLVPETADDEAALGRARAAIEELTIFDRGGAEVRYSLAHELARTRLEGLTTGRGQPLGDGVAVSSLLPMRAIPFRVIFALGLGEGRFPSGDRADAMDLRAAKRQVGDVMPKDRDRYTFLETLLSARERLYLSYVARDGSTGDALAPSVVVTELLETLEHNYLPDAERIVRRPPLSRHEDDAVCRVLPSAAGERRARSLGESFFETTDRVGLTEAGHPETLRKLTETHPELAQALGWIALPEPEPAAPTEAPAVLSLSLSALRRFLESPLQGFARAALRLSEAELGLTASLTDEPFTVPPFQATVALRGSFNQYALFAVPLEVAYEREVDLRKMSGDWPLGAFARIERGRHLEVLERWKDQLSPLATPGQMNRIRFGRASDLDPVDAVRPGIVLQNLAIGGRATTVQLHGRTELLGEGPRTSVIPVARHKGGALGKCDELRIALRGFFDHAALSAQAEDGVPHRAAQLYGDGHRAVSTELAPLSAADARAWLSRLVTDLLSGSHDYVFPIEAVARVADRFEQVDGRELVRSVEVVRERFAGGQSRFGPVRDAARYAPPSPARAAEILRARFSLPLRSMRHR